ncbi:MAG TPA: BMP family ABC transporter substrate-binding protein, partial [Bacilli bacterium]
IKSYYDGGANVVFAAAGGVSTNLKNAAKATGKLAIDVDANQDASVPGSVLTSVLKNTNVAVKDIVEKAVNGTLEGGVEIFYDLNSGATGVTDLSVIEGYIADTEAAQTKWNEIKTKLAEIAADISNGEIDVVDAQSGETLNYSTLTNVVKAN